MPHCSEPELLVLHGVRIQGFTTPARIAERFALAESTVAELLLDFEAFGWVRRDAFGESSGWSLTERGRDEAARRLAAELVATGARDAIVACHGEFLPLNAAFQEAATDWQLVRRGGVRLPNSHDDPEWDERVLRHLGEVVAGLVPVADRLAAALERMGGYPARLSSALARARAGDHRWVDDPGLPSAHLIWMELHEDLLATLGLGRDEPGT